MDFWIFDSLSQSSEKYLDHPKSKSQFFIPFLGFSDSVSSPKKILEKSDVVQKNYRDSKKIFFGQKSKISAPNMLFLRHHYRT